MKYVTWKRMPCRKRWIGTVNTGEELFTIRQRKRPDGSRPARQTLLHSPAGIEVRRGVWSAKAWAERMAQGRRQEE
jgi:hypothetical protein